MKNANIYQTFHPFLSVSVSPSHTHFSTHTHTHTYPHTHIAAPTHVISWWSLYFCFRYSCITRGAQIKEKSALQTLLLVLSTSMCYLPNGKTFVTSFTWSNSSINLSSDHDYITWHLSHGIWSRLLYRLISATFGRTHRHVGRIGGGKST